MTKRFIVLAHIILTLLRPSNNCFVASPNLLDRLKHFHACSPDALAHAVLRFIPCGRFCGLQGPQKIH
eukprot:COSAG03_NODE_771_length_5926_cov_15.851210_6_plen_68_part_00